jgi:methionyl-tRNA formyltransferase
MRVVVATGESAAQRYLVARVAQEHELAGVIVHAPKAPSGSLLDRIGRYLTPGKAFRYLRTRRLLARYEARSAELRARLFHIEAMPDVPHVRVEDINAPEAVRFVRELAPDLLCVNGTNLLREPMLALGTTTINLHTGLSPYSRGGNCNLFMLLEGHPELVGITIHHIDRGIDSGDIIITARAPLEPDDTYEAVEAKNYRLGIDMMLVAIRQLAEGRAARVPQWEQGKLFLRRTGYVYEPSLRVNANRLIEQGLLRDYLAHREERDRGVRLIGELA